MASASGVLLGHEPEDLDQDGVLDAPDICLASVNLDQRDTDADGFGNACDAGLNNDCIVNFQDMLAFKAVFFSDDADADFNGDGQADDVLESFDHEKLGTRFELYSVMPVYWSMTSNRQQHAHINRRVAQIIRDEPRLDYTADMPRP